MIEVISGIFYPTKDRRCHVRKSRFTDSQNVQLLATYVPAFSDAQRLAGSAAAAAEWGVVPMHAADVPAMSGPLDIDTAAGRYDDPTTQSDIRPFFPEVGIVRESGAWSALIAKQGVLFQLARAQHIE